MDIEGAGWAVLSQLLERGLVHVARRLLPADASRTSRRLERFARKSAENLRRAHRSGPASDGRWPACSTRLGMPQVGGRPRSTSPTGWRAGPPGRRTRGRRRRSPDPWFAAVEAELRRLATEEPEALTEVPGIGPTVAAALGRWFADQATRRRPARARRRRASCPSGRPCGRPARRSRAARRQDARRDRHARGLRPAGGRGGDPRRRRQAGGLGVEEDGLPRRRARPPARSWPRPRSWASRSSTRPGSGGCWRARRPDGVSDASPASGDR